MRKSDAGVGDVAVRRATARGRGAHGRPRRVLDAALCAWLIATACAGAQPALATCSCQCVEGVARTACTSVDEARDNPNECGGGGPTVACALPPALTAPPERYAAPKGGIDCRAQRLWDPQTDKYSVVAKVCDLAPVEGG